MLRFGVDRAPCFQVPRIGIGPSVTSLDLAGNQLMMLTSGSLSALRNVVRLKLNNNEIEKILDGAFESTPSLQTLDLSGNNLTVVGREQVPLHNLFFGKHVAANSSDT